MIDRAVINQATAAVAAAARNSHEIDDRPGQSSRLLSPREGPHPRVSPAESRRRRGPIRFPAIRFLSCRTTTGNGERRSGGTHGLCVAGARRLYPPPFVRLSRERQFSFTPGLKWRFPPRKNRRQECTFARPRATKRRGKVGRKREKALGKRGDQGRERGREGKRGSEKEEHCGTRVDDDAPRLAATLHIPGGGSAKSACHDRSFPPRRAFFSRAHLRARARARAVGISWEIARANRERFHVPDIARRAYEHRWWIMFIFRARTWCRGPRRPSPARGIVSISMNGGRNINEATRTDSHFAALSAARAT